MPLTDAVSQYEALREAGFGGALPLEVRCGLVLLLRRGMWAWARFVSAPTIVQQTQTASPMLAAAGESKTAVYVLAAMAMNMEHRGAT